MNPQKIKLPASWTTAQVRVNPKGQVQVKINPSKVGTGRVAKNVVKIEKTTGRKKNALKKRNTRRRRTVAKKRVVRRKRR